MFTIALPDSSEAELQAFEHTCRVLAGFHPDIDFERADGFLTALAAGPAVPPVEDWLPALCGDAFDRAFADPEDHALHLRPVLARLAVLRRQLDPEALLDDPEGLRLAPLIGEAGDEETPGAADLAQPPADEAARWLPGAGWGSGFLQAVGAFPAIWTAPGDIAATLRFRTLLDQVLALTLAPGSDAARSHAGTYWTARDPVRDELIDRACLAVQELRLYWVDHAPRPATRRVAPAPGRNDPCPCGSGRKYKKCHGSA